MKNYECFFFDVDGTLLDNQTHTVPLSTLNGLRKLKELGKKCIICSGRGFIALKEIKELDFIEWDGYILYNGALSVTKENEVLDKHCFDSNVLMELEKKSVENEIVLLYEGNEYWFNRPMNEKAEEGMRFFGKHDAFEIIPYSGQEVCMLMAFEDEFSAFEEIEGIDILDTPHHYADIVQKGISKGNGIQVFCDYFHIPLENTMAFGDGINDLEMLEMVETSIAMGQGRQEIKNIASYVTDDVDKDGLYKALCHFQCI